MINPISLYRKIKKYGVTDPSQLPIAYQNIQGGRPTSDDWTIPWLPQIIQPWGKIPRICRAYRIPLPLKIISGDKNQEWIATDQHYPMSPGMPTKVDYYYYADANGTQQKKPMVYVLSDVAPEPGFSVFAAYLDGEWVECFRQTTKIIFGKRLLFSQGLRADTTIAVLPDGSVKSDFMAWFPEISLTWTK